MSEIVLELSARRSGKSQARAARRNAMLPAVLYGGDKDPQAVCVSAKQVSRALAQGGFVSNIVQITQDGRRAQAIAKDIQFHPVTDEPMHLDLFRVEKGQTVLMEIPVRFTGQENSPGLKRGGALNMVRRVIEVMAAPEAAPEELICDVSGMDIGDNVKFSALELPEGVTPRITDRDFTIATLVGRTAEAVVETPEDADDEATDETEE